MRSSFRHCLLATAMLVFCGFSESARAYGSGLWSYFQKYQLGFDYTNSYDAVTSHYETARSGDPSHDCHAIEGKDDRQRCDVRMTGGSSSGWGLFLQQAFKRQGFFYFDADIGFGARYLQGKVHQKELELYEEAGLPLKEMSFRLAAVVMKPYLQIGITPAKTWPDILLSLGPAAQLAAGRVRVNDEEKNIAVSTFSQIIGGFYELEVVFWRFGDGALSIFKSQDFTAGSRGTRFYPTGIDGMEDIRADFSRSVDGMLGFGIKILLNWP